MVAGRGRMRGGGREGGGPRGRRVIISKGGRRTDCPKDDGEDKVVIHQVAEREQRERMRAGLASQIGETVATMLQTSTRSGLPAETRIRIIVDPPDSTSAASSASAPDLTVHARQPAPATNTNPVPARPQVTSSRWAQAAAGGYESAWIRNKRLRAERHRAAQASGSAPPVRPRVTPVTLCSSCQRGQPGAFCNFVMCEPCCLYYNRPGSCNQHPTGAIAL